MSQLCSVPPIELSCVHTWLVTTKVPNLTTSFVIGMPLAPECRRRRRVKLLWNLQAHSQDVVLALFVTQVERGILPKPNHLHVLRDLPCRDPTWVTLGGRVRYFGRRNHVTCSACVVSFTQFIRLILLVYISALFSDNRGDGDGLYRGVGGWPNTWPIKCPYKALSTIQWSPWVSRHIAFGHLISSVLFVWIF